MGISRATVAIQLVVEDITEKVSLLSAKSPGPAWDEEGWTKKKA